MLTQFEKEFFRDYLGSASGNENQLATAEVVITMQREMLLWGQAQLMYIAARAQERDIAELAIEACNEIGKAL